MNLLPNLFWGSLECCSFWKKERNQLSMFGSWLSTSPQNTSIIWQKERESQVRTKLLICKLNAPLNVFSTFRIYLFLKASLGQNGQVVTANPFQIPIHASHPLRQSVMCLFCSSSTARDYKAKSFQPKGTEGCCCPFYVAFPTCCPPPPDSH